jgi:acetyl esterase/lipase
MTTDDAPATPLAVWEGVPGGDRAGEGHHEVLLTPFLAPGADAQLGVIVCPGGGYARHAPHEAEPIARWLIGLGHDAWVLSYRVAPHRHPLPLRDLQRSIRLVRAGQAGRTAPRSLGILGFSAGGHLCATAATQFDGDDPHGVDALARATSRPDFVILCYPVVSFTDEVHQGCIDNLLGPGADHSARRALSAEANVTPATPPSFIWHTAEDQSVPVGHALAFARALGNAKVPYELHVFPEGRHGLGLAEGHPAGAWTSLAAAWLARLATA